MGSRISRRGFLKATGGAATAGPLRSIGDSTTEGFRLDEHSAAAATASDRIVDPHMPNPPGSLDVPRIRVAIDQDVIRIDDVHKEPAIEDIEFHETPAVEPFPLAVEFFQDVELQSGRRTAPNISRSHRLAVVRRTTVRRRPRLVQSAPATDPSRCPAPRS